jgi:hypothetical protein
MHTNIFLLASENSSTDGVLHSGSLPTSSWPLPIDSSTTLPEIEDSCLDLRTCLPPSATKGLEGLWQESTDLDRMKTSSYVFGTYPTSDSEYAPFMKLTGSAPVIMTDSGYSSIKKTPVSRKEALIPIERIDDAQQPQDENEDCASLYSTAQDMPADMAILFESEISGAILDIVQHRASDTAALGALHSTLSSLLQSFALRLGAPGSSKVEREAMQFVHRHRKFVLPLLSDTSL